MRWLPDSPGLPESVAKSRPYNASSRSVDDECALFVKRTKAVESFFGSTDERGGALINDTGEVELIGAINVYHEKSRPPAGAGR
jgi:hypothetical protein